MLIHINVQETYVVNRPGILVIQGPMQYQIFQKSVDIFK